MELNNWLKCIESRFLILGSHLTQGHSKLDSWSINKILIKYGFLSHETEVDQDTDLELHMPGF